MQALFTAEALGAVSDCLRVYVLAAAFSGGALTVSRVALWFWADSLPLRSGLRTRLERKLR